MILDTVATLILSPLLLFQALSLRKRALRLPEADGPRTGTSGSTGPLVRILIVGDSSAAGVGTRTQDTALAGQLALALGAHYCVQWHLIAQTGATTATTLTRLRSTQLPAADIALVILGVNDVTRGAPMQTWLACHTTLRTLLRTSTGARRLYIAEIPPLGAFPLLPHPLRWLLGRRAIRFDTALRKALKAEPDSVYVPLPETMAAGDMAEDGYHPGPVIYAAWARKIARQILSDGPIGQTVSAHVTKR
jgi:lysophospholipase L1-like esterase